VARSHSRWTNRALAVSALVILVAFVSIAGDLYAMIVGRGAGKSAVTIHINDMGQWWQLVYERGGASFIAANEVHVPAGRRVTIAWNGPPVTVWRSREFLPQEGGRFVFVADRPGFQDLRVLAIWPPNMRRLTIVADRPDDFDKWFANQMRPAANRGDAFLFTSAGCDLCHVVRGVAVEPSMLAPDLTHFGSRHTIAAIDLPNNRGDLSGWIVNSRALKHGSEMPENNLDAAVLHRLVTYLESLR
jgi:cytochrome c oxidase subunit II